MTKVRGNMLVQEFNSVANTLVRFGLLTNCIYFGFETLWNYSQFNKHKSEKDNQNNSPSRTKACKADQKARRSEKNPAKKAPATAFWLVDNSHTTWSHQNLTHLFIGPNSSVLAIGANQSLRGIYITLGYTFWSSIGNFSAYSRVLHGSILLPPRHPSIFARMVRWQ